ncbi:hypothetical protein CAPTEDRAFT_226253 [Capitella teleta]|uniref:WD repeat and coiled-coil-containing protein n=1 Tax=Capitella teleta TaxID=283909 RepID=R7TP25_CAPTE|nr:hypothetical protein CAPTEDRAFT_226253 [Capitella teleta]|eukprot:ELT95399.1 hypothetical protein CAPTEDRAFT_226253 [Capitella teleta]
MELGHCSLRRDGINTLCRALHSKHGLAWTDGEGIYLCPVPFHAFDDSLQNTASSVRLGTFESVSSLHWSADIEAESNINSCPSQGRNLCYLCVGHSNNVSIWSVQGHSPDLSLKHVRKINSNPIPQGCLWNPQRDILCLLNPSQCCFYFRHGSNKGSFSFPVIDSGRIMCGCWSKDGTRLVIGVGEIILVYQWNDIDKSISEYHITAWKIPNIDGSIRSLVSISNHQMACTTELPLDQLCKAQSSNLFDFPEINSSSDSSDSLGCAWNNSSENDLEIACKPHNSHVDTLFNLKRNAQTMASSASSQLLVFAIPKSGLEPPSKMACHPLSGILVPDILLYDDLGDNHRLKGLCSLPGTAVDGVLASRRLILLNEEFNLLLPSNNIIKDSVHASKPLIIDDTIASTPLQVEKVDFSASKPDFENNVDHFTQSFSNGCYDSIAACKAIEASKRNGNDLSSGSIRVEAEPSASEESGMKEAQVSAVDHQIQQQGCQIGQLQKRIDEISRLLDETVQSDYKAADEPDVVHLVYRDLNEIDAEVVESKKAFVLDKNRLQLEAVKLTFGLTTLELFVGNVPCVVSANTSGYIPLIFTRNETYFITGKRSLNTTSTYC